MTANPADSLINLFKYYGWSREISSDIYLCGFKLRSQAKKHQSGIDCKRVKVKFLDWSQ